MIDVGMIFAAGRGERMRPLTDDTPKPLLKVGGKPLIVWQIEALARAGIHDVVINHAWLGEQIPAFLGDGSLYGVRLHYSAESEALETAGGIAQALPLIRSLSHSPVFLAVSGDVFTNYDYAQLFAKAAFMSHQSEPHMHLVMVDNPKFHSEGDFALVDGVLHEKHSYLSSDRTLSTEVLTFGNIGLYDVRQFNHLRAGGKVPMSPFYHDMIGQGRASGEYFSGVWENVGTPEQLFELNERVGALGVV